MLQAFVRRLISTDDLGYLTRDYFSQDDISLVDYIEIVNKRLDSKFFDNNIRVKQIVDYYQNAIEAELSAFESQNCQVGLFNMYSGGIGCFGFSLNIPLYVLIYNKLHNNKTLDKMRVTIKNFRKNLFDRDKTNNNIVVENMADLPSLEMPLDTIHFDGIDDPIRRNYSLDEFDIDWDNENDLEFNYQVDCT